MPNSNWLDHETECSPHRFFHDLAEFTRDHELSGPRLFRASMTRSSPPADVQAKLCDAHFVAVDSIIAGIYVDRETLNVLRSDLDGSNALGQLRFQPA